MAERLHIVLSEEEKERYRAIAEREGESLSAWVRAAIRERAEQYADTRRLRTPADLDDFFAALDQREDCGGGPEPDWDAHERLIDEGRRGGTVS